MGVGTSSPLEKLDVTGSASVSANLTIAQSGTLRSQYGPLNLAYKSGLNAWTTGLTLQDSVGNVGIGSANPAYRLDVDTYGGSTFRAISNNSATGAQLEFNGGSLYAFLNISPYTGGGGQCRHQYHFKNTNGKAGFSLC